MKDPRGTSGVCRASFISEKTGKKKDLTVGDTRVGHPTGS